jgi:alkylhydroperoxidase family enzyme
VQTSGKISPKLKASLAMVSARHNRAWYAVRDAQRRLVGLGMDADEALAIGESSPNLSAGDRAALAFCHKLTVDSRRITDDDVASVKAHFSDHEAAEVIYVTCLANLFDRFTETLSLQAED